MKYQEEVELFKKKKKQVDNLILRLQTLSAKKDYKERLKNGDWSVTVPEWDDELMSSLWDEYEQAISDDLKKLKIEGEIKIMEKRVSVRLSKDSHSVEVEYSGILDSEDFKELSLGALGEAKNLIQLTPTELKSNKSVSTNGTKKSPKDYVKKDFEPKEPTYMKKRDKVSASDITTHYLKGGQIQYGVNKINKGELTLDQVNNIPESKVEEGLKLSGWDIAQRLVFNNFNNGEKV